jgi:ribosomal protein L7/L12
MSLPPELLQAVRQLLQAGRVIDAIKLIKDSTGMGLADAKDIVDTMRDQPGMVGNPTGMAGKFQQPSSQAPTQHSAGQIPVSLQGEVLHLLKAGRLIDAVRRVREETGLSLGQTKDIVDRMRLSLHGGGGQKDATMKAQMPSGGDFTKTSRKPGSPFFSGQSGKGLLFGRLFMGIGLLFFLICGVIHGLHTSFTEKAQAVTGMVVALENSGGKGKIPVISYKWEDETLTIRGKISSSPPAYDKGQRVPLRIDGDTGEVRIDGGLERWFLLVLFGAMGTIFFGIGALAHFAVRRAGGA